MEESTRSLSDSTETLRALLDWRARVSWQAFCSVMNDERDGAEAEGEEMVETEAEEEGEETMETAARERQLATVFSGPGK